MNVSPMRLDSLPRGVFSRRPGMPSFPAGSRMAGTAFRLGQTNEDWYRRARAAVAQYQGLLVRTSQVAARVPREQILGWVGDASVAGTPAYRYASVAADLQYDVERFTPPNVGAYAVERRRNRVEELEEMDQEFAGRVSEAERFYGTLPPTQVVTVPGPGLPAPPAAGPDLMVPLLVAGGGVAAALLLGLI